MQPEVKVLIAKSKEALMKASAGRGIKPGEIKWGSYGHMGRSGNLLLAWGVPPSPLANRAMTAMLDLYVRAHSRKPRIFYVCYGGTHSSVVASMLHLGLLRVDDIDAYGPGRLAWLPYFDRRTTGDIGVPVLIGEDASGSEVYALGSGWLGRRLELCLCDLIEVACPEARACLCNVKGVLDFWARVGGFLSRRLRLVQPGRNLVCSSLSNKIQALKGATRYCLDLSSMWNDNGNHSEGEVIWIDGSKQRRTGLPG